MEQSTHAQDDDEIPGSRKPGGDKPWAAYKRIKAHAFVDRGYAVELFPDEDNWMAVYLPQRINTRKPEVRSFIKFSRDPSQYGIDRGRISKFTMQMRSIDLLQAALGHPHEHRETLFDYNRGPSIDRIDRLPLDLEARKLYKDVLAGS